MEGFTLGTGTRIFVNSNIYQLSGLLSDVTYDFYVRPICSATDTGFWSACNTFTTRCEAQLLPFTEDFEDIERQEFIYNLSEFYKVVSEAKEE